MSFTKSMNYYSFPLSQKICNLAFHLYCPIVCTFIKIFFRYKGLCGNITWGCARGVRPLPLPSLPQDNQGQRRVARAWPKLATAPPFTLDPLEPEAAAQWLSWPLK